MGTYWYCCSGVPAHTHSIVVVLFLFVSAIETLIVACHVLFVTTVWISENWFVRASTSTAAELKFNRNPAIHPP